MKNRPLFLLSALSLSAAVSTGVNAALIDLGEGMIYDSGQDLTWLKDANYAKTSGYDDDGLMDWNEAAGWADTLVYGGYDDWRLATVTDIGNDGCQWGMGGTDCGFNVDTSTSELAYMWYGILGNQAFGGLQSTAAGGVEILNLQSGWYWFGTEYAPYNANAWTFSMVSGQQGHWSKSDIVHPDGVQSADSYAWAVRKGRAGVVADVPEPGTLLLLAAGVAGVAALSRRRRA